MLSAVPIGIPGALLVPIRRPAYFDYRDRPRCAGAVGVFCCAAVGFVRRREKLCIEGQNKFACIFENGWIILFFDAIIEIYI